MAPRITSSDGPEAVGVTSSTRSRETPAPTPHVKGRRVKMATHEELACPPIAWPTIIFFLITVGCFLLPPLLTWNKPTLWTVPWSALAIYTTFTAMHEAAHRAVSSEHRWLNELVGHVAAMVVFQNPFRAFRYIHLEHHKFTNDPVKDPDHWSAGFGPWWLQPLFWMTQTGYYYYHYFAHLGERPKDEVVESLTLAAVTTAAIAWAIAAGYGNQYLHFIWLPRVFTDTFLAYSFDYAPHHPHGVTRAEDIYACTSMIAGLVHPRDGIDLTYPLIYQNYHNIHHLYPTVPFYKYPALWLNHRKELLDLGTPIGTWFGCWRTDRKGQRHHEAHGAAGLAGGAKEE